MAESNVIEELFVQIRTDQKKLKSEVKQLKSQMKREGETIANSFKKGTASMGGMITKMTGLIGGFTALFTVVRNGWQSYRQLDKGMRNVNTIMRVSQGTLKDYTRGVTKIQRELGASSEELTNGLYQAVSAGVESARSLEFLEVATKAAKAGITDVSTSVDGLTTVMNAWQMKTEDAGRVADVMFKTVELGKTTFEEIASSIAMVAPLASAVGVKFEDVFGAIAQLTAQGTPTSVAITQIASAINGMNKELGDGWGDTMSLAEAFEEMSRRAGGSAERLLKMMGRKEGMLATLALTGQNAEKTAAKMRDVANATGAAGRAFQEQTKSMDFRINQMSEKWNSMISNTITKFVPALETAVDLLGQLATKAGNVVDYFASDKFKNSDIFKFMKFWYEGVTNLGGRQVDINPNSEANKKAAEDAWIKIGSAPKPGLDYSGDKLTDEMKNNLATGRQFIPGQGWITVKKTVAETEKLDETQKKVTASVEETVVSIKSLEKKLEGLNAQLEKTSIYDKERLRNLQHQITATESLIEKTKLDAATVEQDFSGVKSKGYQFKVLGKKSLDKVDISKKAPVDPTGLNYVNESLREQTKLWEDVKMTSQMAMGSLVSSWIQQVQLFKQGNSFLGDFINKLGQIAATDALSGLASGLLSLLPGGSWLASLFKAEGGSVVGKRPYIVGEKGPELFVPSSSGTVVPNNQLAGATANGGSATLNRQLTAMNMNLISALNRLTDVTEQKQLSATVRDSDIVISYEKGLRTANRYR